MSLLQRIELACEDFTETASVNRLWKGIPGLARGVVEEFKKRLELSVEVTSVELVLAQLEPGRTYGNNYVVFKLVSPQHAGFCLRCECCLEFPAAMISIDRMPNNEKSAKQHIEGIQSQAFTGENEVNLLGLPSIHAK